MKKKERKEEGEEERKEGRKEKREQEKLKREREKDVGGKKGKASHCRSVWRVNESL